MIVIKLVYNKCWSTDTVEAVSTLGTPNPLVSNAAFGEGLVPDGTATDLLKCTAPVSSGECGLMQE